jgi:hypothetical protein
MLLQLIRNKWTYSTWVKRGNTWSPSQTWGLSVFTSSTAAAYFQFHGHTVLLVHGDDDRLYVSV